MESRIFEASLTGDVTTLHSLLSEDPLLLDRVTLNSVETPLHISSMAGQTEITKEFLALRPKWARQLNQQGLSPLHMASANGHVEIVKEIASVVGADICRLKGQDGKVSLHCAAMKGQVGALRELVSACPESLSEVTVGEETALHLAVKNNQFEAVRVLVEELRKLGRMEIVNWHDREGNTVLHLATFHKQHER
ncbi:ankyrin repeat-containing protein BDA1-like [Humulus lupulus]|uniref:ankyrin repeat-containing protein BDA1-like n=1 Tax=Humulus lupulus TaxID=3486 RepID=UPI002B40D47F|nr:ankyrin repeat-containing protein BDA1-like [Humulus lupulus]